MIYHVAKHGCDRAAGTFENPFKTINRAAKAAVAGDCVVVHEGEYREWVDPQNGGINEDLRIEYMAAEGEHVVIKGSEVVEGWEHVEGGVWKKVLSNAMFGDFNPFEEKVEGDWLIEPKDFAVHLGEVYLGGVAMYEAITLKDLFKAEKRFSGFQLPWQTHVEPILRPEETVYQWHAQVGEDETTLWCNFQDVNPNENLIEINVRPCCFYPRQTGLNYITLRGFEICQAACPFTPPTADQPGMVGAHWSKGWIIEENHLHDAKCSAISIGKEKSTGHNLYSRFEKKPGYQYQMESVFLGLQAGWCKEKIGSHIIRNNVIHDCGQNGVVGHMGCAFSRIEHNHIYNIAVKHEFFGYEIGGIKLHAAVDVVIENNNIHHCTLGTWLDWQAQGTRVTRNLYHHNDRDLMIEVTHGPCLVDNNLFLSEYNLDNMAQGTAYVHNIFSGYQHYDTVLDRATPYHFPHTTQVAGCAVVYGGDERFINNIFTGQANYTERDRFAAGAQLFDRFTEPDKYAALLAAEGNTDEAKFYKIPQPVWCESNAYAGDAKPYRAEKNAIRAEGMTADIRELDGDWVLTLTVPESLAALKVEPVSTARLGAPRITEEPYENPDGSAVDFTLDLPGNRRCVCCALPGPIAKLNAGENNIVVWKE